MTKPSRIVAVLGREVLDSRGNPTIEAEVICEDGSRGRAIAPAGASRGSVEARELRDGDSIRFGGRGVRRAVHAVKEVIQPALCGMLVTDQMAIDQRLIELDSTPQKSRLGGNTLVAVSLAVAHAAARVCRVPLYEYLAKIALELGYLCRPPSGCDYMLPMPMVNMISGGLHAGQRLEFQDFMIIPCGAASFLSALEMVYAVHRKLGELLRSRGYEADLVADEGGYAPRLRNHEEAIDLILLAIQQSGLHEKKHVVLAIDLAASHFYHNGKYKLATLGEEFSTEKMIEYLEKWVEQYPIVSLEDPLSEDDWFGWEVLTRQLHSRVQIVGDDLFATNQTRLTRGIAQGIANSILIKPNQAGTLTETLRVMSLAQAAGYRMVVSARSGESEESWLADLAVATSAGQIKIGCITRSERLAKYNQLLRIEEHLGSRACLAQPFA